MHMEYATKHTMHSITLLAMVKRQKIHQVNIKLVSIYEQRTRSSTVEDSQNVQITGNIKTHQYIV